MKRNSLIIGFLIAFLLSLIWENLQWPLYQGSGGFWEHFWICFVASLGDVIIVGAIYAILALLFRDINWISQFDVKHVFPVLFIGFLVAVGIEKWGLNTGRWQYAEMPTLPLLNVGLLPILQMLIIPPLVFYGMKKVNSK